MGCMHKVFATEIDVELFQAAERTRAGFGTVRLAGYPTAHCRFEVERARESTGERCVNRAVLRLAGRRPRRDPRVRPAGPLRLKVSLQGSDRAGPGHKMQTPRPSRGSL